jgi:phosphoribulokinase
MHAILPQFSVTHINLQRMPLTDTPSPPLRRQHRQDLTLVLWGASYP